MSLWAAAIPAVGSLVGGLLGKKSADKADQTNRDINSQNVDTQKEFATHGIRWKVEDAKAAGIHPLVGLGAPTASFSPSSIGAAPDMSMANMASNMGQDIGRAVQSTRTASERSMADLQIQGLRLDLQGKDLDNQIKNSQLQKMNQVGPSFPGSANFISGQGNSNGRIQEKPMERTASLAGAPHAEPGAISDVGWAKTKTGVIPIPSGDVKQRIEDNLPHEFMHYFRNNITPNFGGGTKPPKSALPKGKNEWTWSYSQQEWQPAYVSPKNRSDRERYNGTIKKWFGN